MTEITSYTDEQVRKYIRDYSGTGVGGVLAAIHADRQLLQAKVEALRSALLRIEQAVLHELDQL
jgi:hypothetical protein